MKFTLYASSSLHLRHRLFGGFIEWWGTIVCIMYNCYFVCSLLHLVVIISVFFRIAVLFIRCNQSKEFESKGLFFTWFSFDN